MPLPPLVTPDEVAEYTQGKVSAVDPRLPALLAGAATAVRRYCRWHVWPQVTETLMLDGPGGRELALPTLHMTALTAATNAGETLDVSTLEWSALGTVRRPGGACWTDRYRGVQVTITHGVEDASDVQQIVKQVVAAALSSPMGATREQAGALSVSWATTAPGVAGGLSLLGRDLAILDTYRLAGA